MKRMILSVVAAAGVVGVVALPNLVSGNARRSPDGTLGALAAAETPYIAQLKGSNEVPAAGDPDGSGAATVSFDALDDVDAEMCWDMAFAGIATPTLAHIHTGAAGVAGPVRIDFGAPTAGSFKGCKVVPLADADAVMANPSGFYVNIHTAEHPGGAIRGQLNLGPAPAGSVHFLPTPLRAYDSRNAPATKFAAGETRTVSLATGVDSGNVSQIAVPPGATAALITITVVQTDRAGFVKIYSAASPEPPTSSANFSAAGAAVTVSTQVAVDAGGNVKVTAGPSTLHAIIEVVGYLY
jgi:hypothetical protein